MSTNSYRCLILFLVAGSLVAIAGCATVKFAPPDPELRSRFGDIGIVPGADAGAPPMEAPAEPVKGKLNGMISGAKQGAMYGLLPGTFFCQGGFRDYHGAIICLYALIAAGVYLAPPAALVGATMGVADARTAKEVATAAEQLEQAFENFSFHVALSEPLPGEDGFSHTGFIHDVLNKEYLHHHPDPKAIEYYLCGPPAMMQAATTMLKEFEVDLDQIAYDEF